MIPTGTFDKLLAGIVFVCGISAILFVLGIFFFVTKEGIGFVFEKMDFREFFLTPYWSPSDAEDPEYGILALMAGTASVTGLAMLVAVPFSLGAAIYIAEFASGKTRECSRCWSNCWQRSRRWSGASSAW
ncbi:MAG: hypothetical protein V5B38_01740 [Candidatus Accumulibacter propinquus]